MYINGDFDRGAQRCDHGDLQVANRIDAVSTQALQQLKGARVAMPEVGGGFEDDIFWQRAVPSHLAYEPKHAFIVDEEAAAAEIIAALDVFDTAQYLLHAAQ